MARFTDTVALLTGVASGVGRSTALRLAEEGASVFGLDINGEGMEATRTAVTEAGGTMTVHLCDVGSVAEVRTAVDACIAEFGRLDVVGNIAGIAKQHHLADVTEAEWDLMNDVNVKGPFFLAQAVMPHLLETGGALINIASNAGLMGQAYTVPYCATKGAIVNLTRALAMEFVKEKVRVNAIAPGGIDTPLVHDFELAEGVDFALMQNHMGFRPPSTPGHTAAFFALLARAGAVKLPGAILSAYGGPPAA